MIKLNLLSSQEKEEIRWEKINRILIINGTVIIAELVIFIVLFLAMDFYLSREFSKIDNLVVQKQQEAEVKEIGELKIKTQSFNERLNLVDEIQNQQISWTKILEKLSLITPESVQIISLDISPKNNETDVINSEQYLFNLVGHAKTREDMLEFENKLKDSDYFSNLESNRSNYLESYNVNFRYRFNLAEKILN
jgi:Tfp pilus assembly protein PilN